MFIDSAITTWPFPVLWPHSHGIANHFPVGHPSFHYYSSSSTLNYGVLNGCMTEKVSHIGRQINSLKSFSIYHNSGCYNWPSLKEHNVLVTPRDKFQDAFRVITEMVNLALIPLITPCPPTDNGPPTLALSACGPHHVLMVGALIF